MNKYLDKAPTVIQILNKNKKQEKTMLAVMRKDKTPFQLLIATILSARARDEMTSAVADELFKKYPDAETLSNAKPADVKKIIKRIGFYNNKTKMIIATAKKIHTELFNEVPKTLEKLQELPGVGMKVAKCVMVYAYNLDAIPADTHVHRIANRLGWVNSQKPNETSVQLEKKLQKKYWQFVNEVLVIHGKTICLPRKPNCEKCSVKKYCRYYWKEFKKV